MAAPASSSAEGAGAGAGSQAGGSGGSCGDGALDPGEACDDGNAAPNDGCNPDCSIAARLRWSRAIDLGGHELATALAVDASGEIVLAGTLEKGDGFEAFVQRLTPDGEVLWTEVFGEETSGHDEATAVAVDGEGNALVVGKGSPAKSPMVPTHAWARKYAPDGTLLWKHEFAKKNGAWDRATGVAVGSTGEAFVTGLSAYPSEKTAAWLARFEASGELSSIEDIAVGSKSTRCYAVAIDEAGDLFLGGSRQDGEDGWEPPSPWVMKRGAAGPSILPWEDPTATSGTVVGLAARGGMLLAIGDGIAGPTEGLALKAWSADGQPLWSASQSSGEQERWWGGGVALDAAKSAFAVGRVTKDLVQGDALLVKYGSSGELHWKFAHDGSAGLDDVGMAVAIAPDGDPIATGYERGLDQTYDIWLARFAP